MGKQLLVYRWGCPCWLDEEDVMKKETIYGWRGMSINVEPKCINDDLIGATAEPMGHRHDWHIDTLYPADDAPIPNMFKTERICDVDTGWLPFASVSLIAPRPADVWKDKPFIKQIIYNGTTTVCIFHDNTKVISRPQKGEKFDKETGVAMCIAKYIYGSRSKFLKAVEKGHQQ